MGTTRIAGACAVQTGAGELAGQVLCSTVQCGVYTAAMAKAHRSLPETPIGMLDCMENFHLKTNS